VKFKSEKLLEIRDIEEKLENLCSRVYNLESISSRYNNNNNGELQVVTTGQSSDLVNRQEQQVNAFLVFFLFVFDF